MLDDSEGEDEDEDEDEDEGEDGGEARGRVGAVRARARCRLIEIRKVERPRIRLSGGPPSQDGRVGRGAAAARRGAVRLARGKARAWPSMNERYCAR